MIRSIDDIVKHNLCLGCGLCEAINPDSILMQKKDNGFIEPMFKSRISKEENDKILKICPGININNNSKFTSKNNIWGNVIKCYSSFSLDNEVRTIGSSGGIISEVAIYLLDTKQVDKIIQVGSDCYDFTNNQLIVSRDRDDILSCAGSRYAPVSMFRNIIKVLSSNNDRYCIIGKPCDISGMKNFLSSYPQYTGRIKFYISNICAGIPSFKGTQKLVDSFFSVEKPIRNLKYRGNGWPGYFSFTDSSNKNYSVSYNDSWGKVLGREILFRCKICPDGIGLESDIVVGDAWNTKDGYPDFSEMEGISLVLSRTKKGESLLQEMSEQSKISKTELDISLIKDMQPFQYNRRLHVAARLLAFMIIRCSVVKYKGTFIWTNLLLSSVFKSVREFLGTARRLLFK